jgi:hypothetical protein
MPWHEILYRIEMPWHEILYRIEMPWHEILCEKKHGFMKKPIGLGLFLLSLKPFF